MYRVVWWSVRVCRREGDFKSYFNLIVTFSIYMCFLFEIGCHSPNIEAFWACLALSPNCTICMNLCNSPRFLFKWTFWFAEYTVFPSHHQPCNPNQHEICFLKLCCDRFGIAWNLLFVSSQQGRDHILTKNSCAWRGFENDDPIGSPQ